MQSHTLRKARADERDFIFDAFRQSLRPYVEWAWGWDETHQSDGFWSALAAERFDLICVGEDRAGALYVEDRDDCRYIRTLFLCPGFQGKGIGTRVLEQQVALARASAKGLELRVIRINPALRLYLRMGFVVVQEDAKTLHLRLD